jgi:hypothetical protein
VVVIIVASACEMSVLLISHRHDCAQGRTETVRPVTERSCAFVMAMLDKTKSPHEKLKALQVPCVCVCVCVCVWSCAWSAA